MEVELSDCLDLSVGDNEVISKFLAFSASMRPWKAGSDVWEVLGVSSKKGRPPNFSKWTPP